MDALRTPSSPRDKTPSFSHKVSARRRTNRVSASPRTEIVSPRPPPCRPSPRFPNNNGTPRGRTASVLESFRSVAVLEEIVRVENIHAQSSMTADDAFALLHRLIPRDALQGLSPQELLDGLEAACWRCFGPGDHSTATTRVPYAQLYQGLLESIHEKEDAMVRLGTTLKETIHHTNTLPRRIKAHETEIATTIASFVSLSAASLDCAVQRDRQAFGSNLLKPQIDTDRLAHDVRDRIATLRRRKDLRTWACEQLRNQINDHLTRASELKKEITLVLGDVKKEELVHKVKTERMEEAMASMAAMPTGRKNSMMGGIATKMLVGGGLAAMATAAALSSPSPVAAGASLAERQALAHERRHDLEAAIVMRRDDVRRRTEEIFDVRNEVKALEATKRDLLAQVDALEEGMVQIQRACTPRPDWEELQRVVTVTTAADHVGRTIRTNLHSRDRRSQRTEASDVDDDVGTAHKLEAILTSTWTTVEKVEALVNELCRIREKYHGGEEVTAERAKLAQLQKEIQQTLSQLSTIRQLASRGGTAA